MNVNAIYYVGGAVATVLVGYFLNRMVEWCKEIETNRRTNIIFDSDEQKEMCYRMAQFYPSENYTEFERMMGLDSEENIRHAKEDIDAMAKSSREFQETLEEIEKNPQKFNFFS